MRWLARSGPRGGWSSSCCPPFADAKPEQIRLDAAERHDGAVIGCLAQEDVLGNEKLKHFPLPPQVLIGDCRCDEQRPGGFVASGLPRGDFLVRADMWIIKLGARMQPVHISSPKQIVLGV